MANKKNTQPSAMEETLNKSEAFVLKYKKPLMIALVAIIVIIAGAILVNNYVIKPRAEKASTILAKGQEYFNNEDFDKALNGDKVNFPGFVAVANDYSSTDAGNLAKLYAGLTYAEKDDVKNAIKFIESFKGQGDAMISPAAIAALGNCYVKKGDTQKGIDLLLKAAKTADNDAVTPVFLLQAGQLYESLNQQDKALELYQQIKDKYFRSPLSAEIDKYIERATK